MIVRFIAMVACLASAFIALSLCMQKDNGKQVQVPTWLVPAVLIFMGIAGAIAIPDPSLTWNF